MEFVIYPYGYRLGMASIMMTDDDYGSDDNGNSGHPPPVPLSCFLCT